MIRHTDNHILLASTDRTDGNVDERFGKKEETVKNRRSVCAGLSIGIDHLVFADQQHGIHIAVVSESDLNRRYLGSTQITGEGGVDGLITAEKNVFLVIQTADCLPVFFYDQQKEVVGIAHCGWKGLYRGLAEKMVELFLAHYGSHVDDIEVQVGPAIHACCYRVDQVIDRRLALFRNQCGNSVVTDQGYLDLPAVLQWHLTKQGVERINISPVCTACDTDYFSYYREKKNLTGQQAHIIGIRP